MYILLMIIGLGAAGFAIFDAVRRGNGEFTHADRLSKVIWLGILAAAIILASIPVTVLQIAAIAVAGAYLGWAMPALRSAGRAPVPTAARAPVPPTPARSVPTAPTVSAEASQPPAPSVTEQPVSLGPDVPVETAAPAPAPPGNIENMGPVEMVTAIRDEAIEKGFFVKHKIATHKKKRNKPTVATMTATSITNSKFTIEVKVTEYSYGTSVESRYVFKLNQRESNAAAALSTGGGFSRGLARGLQARKEAKFEEASSGVAFELEAFRKQVLDKYHD